MITGFTIKYVNGETRHFEGSEGAEQIGNRFREGSQDFDKYMFINNKYLINVRHVFEIEFTEEETK